MNENHFVKNRVNELVKHNALIRRKSMKVTFLDPRESISFHAEVNAETTGETCIQGLIEAKFIQPPPRGLPYSLLVTRTQRQVLPSMTLGDANVQENDALAVLQMEQGAGQ